MVTDYTKLAAEIGALVTSKQQQYGNSVSRSGRILEILYPDGVQPHQYTDALLVVRILDKLSRIAQRGLDGQDLGGESPYRDIAGYGLLGASKDEDPMVEAAKESYPVETLANKSPQWDEEYAGFRRQGYGAEQAARLADDVCQSSTE